jgi:hypothetical protein
MRAVEGAALALFALLTTLAAAVLSGARLSAGAAYAAGSIAAAACAATWMFERQRSAGQIAARMDRRLDQNGALLTAFECEESGAGPAVQRALVARVARQLRPEGVRACVPAPSLAFAALPALATALLAWTLEAGAPRDRGSDLAALSRAVAASLAVATGPSEAADGTSARLAELAQRLRAASEPGRKPAPAGELEEIEAELARLAENSAAKPELRARLEAARELARAAAAGPETRDGRPARRESDPGRGSGLANGSAGSTMAGSPTRGTLPRAAAEPFPADESAPAPAPGEQPPEVGTLAGRWWPERYDALVSDWIESRRAAQTPGENGR